MLRHTLSLIALCLVLGAACADELPLRDRACPCADGWVCCEGAAICAADPSECPAATPMPTPSGDPGCVDACVLEAGRCSDEGAQRCELGRDGCTRWSAPEACGTAEYCFEGRCACLDTCAPGTSVCTATPGVQRCELNVKGCWSLGRETRCDEGRTCHGGRCVLGCIDRCTPGQRWCDGTDGLQRCEIQADGCLGWSDTESCHEGAVCRDGVCLSPACIDGSMAPAPETCDGIDEDCNGLIDELVFEPEGAVIFGDLLGARLDGDLLVLTDGYGLHTYDVSVPSAPAKLGEVATAGTARAVALREGLAYVADGGAGLRIIDVGATGDPGAPMERAHLPLVGNSEAIEVAGDLAFVAIEELGVQLVDISDPDHPLALVRLDADNGLAVTAMTPYAGHLLVGHGHTLDIYDVRNALEPRLSGSLQLRDSIHQVAADSGVAYVASWREATLTVVNISNLEAPEALEPIALPNSPTDARIDDRRLLLSTSGHGAPEDVGLLIYDLDDRLAPARVGTASGPRSLFNLRVDQGLAVSVGRRHSEAGRPMHGAWIFDVTQSANAGQVATIEEEVLAARSIAVRDNIAVVADAYTLRSYELDATGGPREIGRSSISPNDGTLSRPQFFGENRLITTSVEGYQIFDFSDPTQPRFEGYVDLEEQVWDLKLEGDRLYVTGSHEALRIFDFSDPLAPRRLSGVDGFAMSVLAEPERAFLLGAVNVEGEPRRVNALRILDTSVLGEPRELSRVLLADYSLILSPFSGIRRRGNTLFVNLRNDNQLATAIVDISDPTAPVLVGAQDNLGLLRTITERDVGILALIGQGIAAMDLRDPLAPQAAGSVDTPGEAWDVALFDEGQRIAVADTSGISVYRLGGCR